MSNAHNVSDTDSDATIEPPDYSGCLDGSQDLFDTTSGSSSIPLTSSFSSLDNSKQSIKSSPKMTSKLKPNSLLKKVSKTHEISDSDNDSGDDAKSSKLSVGFGKDRSSRVTSSPKASPYLKPSSMSKRVSKTHDISNSEGDSEEDSRTSKSAGDVRHKGKGKPTTAGSSSFPPTQNSLSRSLSKPSNSASSINSKNLSKNRGSDADLKSSKSVEKSLDGSAVDHDRPNQRSRQACKYGDRCYRTNPEHFQEFDHEGENKGKRKNALLLDHEADAPKKTRADNSGATSYSHGQGEEGADSFMKTVADVYSEFQPLSFFLTKVAGIDNKFNSTGAVSLKDILSPLMGNLEASCQFNFMTDIPWLVKQYPKQFRNKPLLLVHGEQGRSETELKEDGAPYSHISFCRAKLEMMYGTHHTKMMLLLYDCGMRVVIHTSNLISGDWYQKTQGVWISPLFPKLTDKDTALGVRGVRGDSATRFKADLLDYLAAYRAVPLTAWEKHIQQHDMSSANVYIIGSVPGRHTGQQKSAWGHLKLRKVLQESGPDKKDVGSWPVYGQFSSIGSLGANPDQWLCDEWLGSLSQCQGMMGTPLHHSKLQLVYPSKENVRLCLEGYAGGGCLPYSIKTAQKQIYLNNYVRKWGSEGRGRTGAIPHIKTYSRVSPDYSQAAWFLVTSANLSKAAWGAMEKQKTQLMIRSYEIGVLFLPKHFGTGGSFPVAKTAEEVTKTTEVMLPFPYDLPPPAYQKGDRIWMWDVPCVDLPDTHGKKYCPRL